MINKEEKYNKQVKMLNQILKVIWKKDVFKVYGLFILRKMHPDAPDVQKVIVGEYEYDIEKTFSINLPKALRVVIYAIQIPYSNLELTKVHNPLYVSGVNEKGEGFRHPLSYNLLRIRIPLMLRSSIYKLAEHNLSLLLRNGGGNSAVLTIRDSNITDSALERRKLLFAFLLSRLLFWKKVIVLFEKKSETFEESASMVYKRLIDSGYTNAYFILGDEKRDLYNIEEKYQKNIIQKYSFKHYLLYFTAKTFLATETPFHGLELRTVSRVVLWYILYGRQYKYVFLQHGVMYMVSLDSKTRGDFRKGGWVSKHGKIVVSSKAEADHFIELGGYEKEDLYITGLPKFDHSYKHKDATNIIIMPTWRPWEEALAKSSPEKSGYYKMILEMFNSVPNKLKEHIVILPHPLILKGLQESDLGRYVPDKFSYDIELRSAKLVITDYSSIAYDAFYRGTNVIFWWKDIDECMEEYQAHLMLNQSNVFGDICYSKKELKESIQNNYSEIQSKKYLSRFLKLVDFKDGKNTERLIEFLITEKVI